MKEDGLLNRIQWMSVAIACFATVYLASLGRIPESISFLLGAVVSVAFFWILRVGVEHAFRTGLSRRSRLMSALVSAAKYGLAAWLISLMVRWPDAKMGFFLAGATTVPAVIVLKALGQLLADASSHRK